MTTTKKANFSKASKVGPSDKQKGELRQSISHGTNWGVLSKMHSIKHFLVGGKGRDPPKDSSNSSLDSNKGKDGKNGQPPLPPIILGWGGMAPNLNPYFPWYPSIPLMMVIARNSNGGRKLLN